MISSGHLDPTMPEAKSIVLDFPGSGSNTFSFVASASLDFCHLLLIMNTDELCYKTLDFGRMVFLLLVPDRNAKCRLSGSSNSIMLRGVTLFLWLAACLRKVVQIYHFPRAL